MQLWAIRGWPWVTPLDLQLLNDVCAVRAMELVAFGNRRSELRDDVRAPVLRAELR
jgi:hypothetical protein